MAKWLLATRARRVSVLTVVVAVPLLSLLVARPWDDAGSSGPKRNARRSAGAPPTDASDGSGFVSLRPPAPIIRASRVGDHAIVRYAVPRRATSAAFRPVALLLTVDSPTDDLGPATYGVNIRKRLSGRKLLPLPLRDTDDYVVRAKTYTRGAQAVSHGTSTAVPGR
jgi:hypothetical protein